MYLFVRLIICLCACVIYCLPVYVQLCARMCVRTFFCEWVSTCVLYVSGYMHVFNVIIYPDMRASVAELQRGIRASYQRACVDAFVCGAAYEF